MTKPQFEELLKDNLKKYFKNKKFNNIPKETIDKFTAVNPSLNEFNIVDQYNKTLSKKDNNEYTLLMDKEKEDELKTLKKEKKQITAEMRDSTPEYTTTKG